MIRFKEKVKFCKSCGAKMCTAETPHNTHRELDVCTKCGKTANERRKKYLLTKDEMREVCRQDRGSLSFLEKFYKI